MAVIDTVLMKEPDNADALSVKRDIMQWSKGSTPVATDIRAGYSFDAFSEPYNRFWQVLNVGAGHRFGWGPAVAGINIGNVTFRGYMAPEAIEAAGLLAEDRRGIGVLAVTSADRLSAGWHAAQRAREQGDARGARARRGPAGGAAARCRHRHGDRRLPRGAVLARRRVRPSRARAGRRALRPVGLALRALRPLRPRRERHPGRGRGPERPAGAVSVLAEVP